MTEIISFEIYKTKNTHIHGELFLVFFAKRKDREEYALFAENIDKSIGWSGFYSKEAASELEASTEQQLAEHILKTLGATQLRGGINV